LTGSTERKDASLSKSSALLIGTAGKFIFIVREWISCKTFAHRLRGKSRKLDQSSGTKFQIFLALIYSDTFGGCLQTTSSDGVIGDRAS
jgi:hypothetical protein